LQQQMKYDLCSRIKLYKSPNPKGEKLMPRDTLTTFQKYFAREHKKEQMFLIFALFTKLTWCHFFPSPFHKILLSQNSISDTQPT
jgi:hypothetical protein